MFSISEFCKKHRACGGGRKWALQNCETMWDAWNTAKPEWVVWIATRTGVIDTKSLVKFACFCARQNWGLLTDERSKHAIVVAEKYLDGNATLGDLNTAAAAYAAAYTAADAYAATDAATYATRAAAAYAAAYAAADAARAAAYAARAAAYAARATYAAYAAADAAADAARATAYAAAYATDAADAAADAADAAYAEQCEWLRKNITPNFE